MVAEPVPAVVLGSGVNGLGVARSLARFKVPVWLVDSDGSEPAMHTRAAKPLQICSMQGDALVAELERLGTSQFSGQRPVLLLTQEESVKAVSHQRARLAALYRFSLPAVDIVDALLHKHGFQQLAERFGAPIPKLVHVATAADLSAVSGLRYPVVIKPGERNAGYSRQFKKAYRVDSAVEAIELVGRILAVMPDVVVQEWIEGPDSGIHFCLQHLDQRSQVVASFTGRKIRSWPPHVGGTASCTAAPEAHDELSATTARFFHDVGVTGMASMEYKRDERDGAFYMVEPTIGRTDYQEEVATLNGVNVPHAAYRTEMGLPLPPSTVRRTPVVWRVRSEDLQSAMQQGQRAGEGFPRGSHVVDALWRWKDPRPFLAQNLLRVRRRLTTHIPRHAPQTARDKP